MRSAPSLGPRTNTLVGNPARELTVSIHGVVESVRQFRREVRSNRSPKSGGPVELSDRLSVCPSGLPHSRTHNRDGRRPRPNCACPRNHASSLDRRRRQELVFAGVAWEMVRGEPRHRCGRQQGGSPGHGAAGGGDREHCGRVATEHIRAMGTALTLLPPTADASPTYIELYRGREWGRKWSEFMAKGR